MIGFIVRVLLSFTLAYLLFNCTPMQENVLRYTDIALDFFIDYLTEVKSELYHDLHSHDEKSSEIEKEYDLSNHYRKNCPHHKYTTRIVHRNPLIIYIENFLTKKEIQHLLDITEGSFEESTLYTGDEAYVTREERTSTSATILRHLTPTVECIERRFAEFQGGVHVNTIEPMQVVQYTATQQFKEHYDLIPNPEILENGGQRVTSFFTYLQANCTHGETEFLKIPFVESIHRKFCDILTCDEDRFKHGLRFRPIAGNTLFWYNTDVNGHENFDTLHAGHPPGENGHKFGLNTWTRERILWLDH